MQNTHNKDRFRELHVALIEIVGLINKPRRDETLLQSAGVDLDRALFPLLVGVERFGPIGVGELADGVGRDYTTVSRQVAKLETLGLVVRNDGPQDRRVRQAAVTAKGRALIERIDDARDRYFSAIFSEWASSEVDELGRLLRRFADGLKTSTTGETKPDDLSA